VINDNQAWKYIRPKSGVVDRRRFQATEMEPLFDEAGAREENRNIKWVD
jgi:hypothetical protein